MTYLYLALAIVAEVVATTFLKLSDGFSKPLPSAVTVLGYAVAFYFLSLTLRSLPTGLVYAVWSGVGVVLIATIAWVFQSQRLDAAALCGMGLIVSGVVVINLFSSFPPLRVVRPSAFALRATGDRSPGRRIFVIRTN